MQKYYPGGILQTSMNFDNTGRISYVKMYYETGDLASEGKYIDQKKDSVWNFYSRYDKRKAVTEEYKMGEKHGPSYKFYQGGKPSEYHEWEHGKKNGKWEQYYENDQIRLTGWYVNDSLNGEFLSYNPDGTLSIKGNYSSGAMDGNWIYYTEAGDQDFIVEYIDGKMVPNPEIEKRIEEFSKKVKDAIGNLDEVELPESE
jgi:antitoxin component YwqK of YwqJK toxin-antitoxin module